MRKIISFLVVMALMTAGVPMAFAANGGIQVPPPEGVIQQDNPADTIDVVEEGPNYTGLALGVGAGLIAIIAIAASGGDGTTTPPVHTPPAQ